MCNHEERDRAEGWTHAKRSGHLNEDILRDILLNDIAYQSQFLSRIGIYNKRIVSINGGGISETHVPSVFRHGDLTTPKADMYIKLDNGENITFSIKKSLSGQVYLVTIENFIEAYEQHFEPIPDDVRRGIELFWGSAQDTTDIINRFGAAKTYELRKHRAVGTTLRRFSPDIHAAFLTWFVRRAGNIAELCFARGGAKYPQDWARYVWYKNELGETSVDKIFKVSDICEAVSANAMRFTYFGNVNGGSTIQLPFGFVQWHSPQKTIPGSLQFHHKFASVNSIMPNDKLH